MERIGPTVRPKPAYIEYKRSRPAVAVWVAAVLFGAIAVGASAKNELLRGHVSINERQKTSTPKVAAPKATADLAAKYGSAASSPAIAGAIKKAEKAPDARTVSDAQEALAHGNWKPGANPVLAVMHGDVPPGWSQQQAAMLYTTVPHLPRMPGSITAENADRYAGVTDPLAGLPQGMSRVDTQAANEQMFYGDMRHRSGPICVPPLHRDHNWLAAHARKSGNSFVVQNDHQISLISPEYSGGKSGSIREMTDSSGNIVYQQSFDPYGNSSHLQGGSAPDFGYQGYYVHQRSGLNLTATRAYSPKLGRFLNRDRINEYGGINLFAYCGNDPVSKTDPTGQSDGMGTDTNPYAPWDIVYPKGNPYQFIPDISGDIQKCLNSCWSQAIKERNKVHHSRFKLPPACILKNVEWINDSLDKCNRQCGIYFGDEPPNPPKEFPPKRPVPVKPAA